MRRIFLCLALGSAWLLPASCSGGGTTADAGPDTGPPDVAYEYNVRDVPPPPPTVVDVAAGAQHTCMIVDYNGVYATYCFGIATAVGGAADGGTLVVASDGLGTMHPALLSLTSSHGAGHTCGIDLMHQVWCWGDNTYGQCGQGASGNTITAPSLGLDSMLGFAEATYVSAGTRATCMARKKDGQLMCFGDNASCEMDLYSDAGCGQYATNATGTLGTDDGVVFGTISTVGEGMIHGCVSGQAGDAGAAGLFCYGDNATLESGPAGKSITVPAAQISSSPVASIGAGDTHTCFVTAAHGLYCFGANDMHQASPTSTTNPIDPTTIQPITLPSSAIASTVAVRAAETCVVDTTGLLWCFGSSHGTNVDQVMGVKDVAKVVLGQGHTCVIGHLPSNSSGDPVAVLCWGDNTNGQCGQAAGGMITTPTAVTYPASAPP